MLVGDYEEYAVGHVDVGVVVYAVDEAHEASGTVVDAATGLRVAADYTHDTGECLYDERLFGLHAADA